MLVSLVPLKGTIKTEKKQNRIVIIICIDDLRLPTDKALSDLTIPEPSTYVDDMLMTGFVDWVYFLKLAPSLVSNVMATAAKSWLIM